MSSSSQHGHRRPADERRERAPRDQASRSVPMRVDWIPPDLLRDGLPGRLGLTFLPGKHGISTRYPGLVYERILDEDLARLRAEGVGVLLLLVEDEELARWGDPRIIERGRGIGLEVRRHPIRDGGTPASPRVVADLLAALQEARGRTDAAIACMGGVGRTGLLAACALVEAGSSAEDAIGTVRKLRHPDAVETPEQERFVREYAAWRGAHG